MPSGSGPRRIRSLFTVFRIRARQGLGGLTKTNAIDRGYAGKRLTQPTRCAVKPLYPNAAVACPWIPAYAGMTVSKKLHPYLVIPAQAGIQKGHCNT